jgi:glycosyltransferase involved in cell wall biosynthesis
MASRKKILIICPYPENVAPSQRLKYEQYFEHFRNNNFDIVVSPFMSRRFWNVVYKKGRFPEKIYWTLIGYLKRVLDLFRLPFYKGLYIHLWVAPFGGPIFEYLFCLLNRNVIYDIDDMIFLAPSNKANKSIAAFKNESRMIYLMKKAKHVIVCTPKLETFVRQYNSNTTDISSTINTDLYIPINNYANDHALTLGWSGSHSTSKYLLLLEEVLKKIKNELDVNILVIGDPTFSFKSIKAEVLPWTLETELRNLQRIDIGLYPLPDEEWVYGKSGLKALQYMALGIPTIASAIGANFRVIEHNVSGFLVRSEQEWIDTIMLLINNPQLRKRIGEEARKRVELNFSINANRDVYLKIFKKVFA